MKKEQRHGGKMYDTKKFLRHINDAKEQQYLMLREAVWKHMEAQRNISIFAITTILAFYTIIFSMEIKTPYVFLIPIIVLLPFSYKELDHKISISYIAGYQIVCLENNRNVSKSFTWETDYFLFKRKKFDSSSHILFDKLLNSEFLILSIVSYALYVIYFSSLFFNKDEIWCFDNVVGYVCGSFFLIIIIIIGQITKGYNLYSNSIEHYVKKWLKFMLDEGRIDLETYKERFTELIGEEPQNKFLP